MAQLFALLIVSLLGLFVDGCRLVTEDPCKSVTCREGQACVSRRVYCKDKQATTCPPVAQCIDLPDPCKSHQCPKGTKCVTTAENCGANGCEIRPKCNEVNRSGRCPPKTFADSCATDCQDDHFCPEGHKCCETNPMGDRKCMKTA